MSDDPNVIPGSAGAGEGGQGGETKWFSSFENAELRGFAENKGWKDPGAAVESYRQLEKTIGVPPERLLRLPEKADDPGWGAIKEKLGFAAPAKPEDYGIQVPEGADPQFAAKAATKLHELGVPKDMANALVAWQNGEVEAAQAAEALAQQQRSDADMVQLRQDWGGQFDASTELARRAVAEFGPSAGLDADALNHMEAAMGTANFMRLWAAIGSKSGESKFVDGGDANSRAFSMSPDAAKSRIAALTQDSGWFARWNNGDVQAVDEWKRLNIIAGGGKP